MSFLQRNWSWLVLLLVPVLVLWPCLGGSVPGGFGPVGTMQPWGHNPAPGEAWDVLSADGALQFYAWRDLVFEGWKTGQLPLWNPYQFCGTPLLANSQSAPFYPLHIAMGLLHISTSTAIVLLAWIHLALAGVGAWLLARRLGCSDTGACLAGGFFSTSVFMSAWIALPSVATTVCWVPWAMAFGIGLVQGVTLRRFLGLSATVGLMLLGGHLQFAAFGLIGLLVVALGALFTADNPWRERMPSLAAGAAAVGLGVMLSAVQVVPSLQFSKLSHRQSKPSAEGWAAYSKSAVQPWEFTAIAFPQIVGVPSQLEPESGEAKLSKYWPSLAKPGAHMAESAVSVCLPALVLLALIPWKREGKRVAPMVVLAAVGLLLATGVLTQALYFGLPGWSATGSPGRASFLWVLALCVLAARGWNDAFGKDIKVPAAVVVAILVVTVLLSKVGASLAPWSPNLPLAQLSSLRLLDALPVMLVIGGLCVAAAWKLDRRVSLGLLVASAVVSVVTVPIPAGPVPFTPKEPDATKRYAFVNSGWGLIQTPRALMPPDTATSQRMLDVAGYDSLIDRSTVEMLRDIDGQDPAPAANGNIMHIKPSFDPDKLAAAGVSEVWSLAPLKQSGLTALGQEGGFFKYQLGGKRFDYPGGSVTRAEDRLDGLVIEVEGSGPLTVKDHMMDGWACQVDGQLTSINEPWRTVETGSSGKHRVEFRYRPAGFGNGIALTSVAVAVFVFLGSAAVALAMRGRASNTETQ